MKRSSPKWNRKLQPSEKDTANERAAKILNVGKFMLTIATISLKHLNRIRKK